MKIIVYYEDKKRQTILDVSDSDCEIWVEADYQKRLEDADDGSKVKRRTPQQIMDEECNKPTFNSHQRETRRHVSLDAYDADHNLVSDDSDFIEELILGETYKDLYEAIKKLKPKQEELIKKVFWEDIKQIELAKREGVSESAIAQRMIVIYKRLIKYLQK